MSPVTPLIVDITPPQYIPRALTLPVAGPWKAASKQCHF